MSRQSCQPARRWRGGLQVLLPAVLGLAVAILPGCAEQPQGVAELSGSTMGTTYSIKLSPPPDAATRAALQRRIDQRLEEVNRQMSTYRDDSDLMRFNRSTSDAWQPMPQGVVALVAQAAAISEASNGIYDVTVGPLVNLWGFGGAGRRDTPPSADEISALLPAVGYHKLHARAEPPALRKDAPALQVDLSSIAKGWGVDEIARLLDRGGHANYLVEIGGELRAAGRKDSGEPWRIAIERPLVERRDVQRVVALSDMAMATSGDYRNFFEDRGRRYSHTIDPSTGQAVRHRLASVTVFADDCATADAWATALLALGEARGPALAKARGIAALFVVRNDDRLEEQVSPALAATPFWQDAQSPAN